MRKSNLFTVVLLGSTALLSACSSSVREKKTDTTAPAATTAPSHAVVKSPPLVSPLHQTYVLDDKIEYAIDSLKKSKSLGEMKKGRTASEGNFFYIVSFRARNGGTEPATVSIEPMTVKGVDSEGYQPSPAGQEAVILNGGPKEMFACKLEPGEAKPFLAIFDMPPAVIEGGADFIIPSTKSGSQDRWVVRLDNSKKHH
ncbi:MAG: hypothetical protein JST89_13315 [Cyanobacteria bacterium SZAS-4]|nr:hypothetical protein [Cyanobacteria bacterium SZAS-4]